MYKLTICITTGNKIREEWLLEDVQGILQKIIMDLEESHSFENNEFSYDTHTVSINVEN